jgi:hypothetical protein
MYRGEGGQKQDLRRLPSEVPIILSSARVQKLPPNHVIKKKKRREEKRGYEKEIPYKEYHP